MVLFWSFLVSIVAYLKTWLFCLPTKRKEHLLPHLTLMEWVGRGVGVSDSNVILTLRVTTLVWMSPLRKALGFESLRLVLLRLKFLYWDKKPSWNMSWLGLLHIHRRSYGDFEIMRSWGGIIKLRLGDQEFAEWIKILLVAKELWIILCPSNEKFGMACWRYKPRYIFWFLNTKNTSQNNE